MVVYFHDIHRHLSKLNRRALGRETHAIPIILQQAWGTAAVGLLR